MVETTPHLIVGPFDEVGAGIALRAATAQFGPVEAELTHSGDHRNWILLRWPKGAPDHDTQMKVLGFCHGAAWVKNNQ